MKYCLFRWLGEKSIKFTNYCIKILREETDKEIEKNFKRKLKYSESQKKQGS